MVDDLSTDNTDEVLKSWTEKDNRFKYFKRHREPKGAPTCRNIGLEKARGEYVMFLDSDDLLAGFCIERRVRLFTENSNCDFLAFQTSVFYGDKRENFVYFNIENGESTLHRFLRTESLWAICGAIYKSSVLLKNQFDESISFWQDVDLTVRMLLQKPHYKTFLKLRPDCFIRILPYSVSRDGGFNKNEELLGQRIDILLSFKEKAKENGFELSKVEENTLYNFTYLLSRDFLLKFGNKKKYFNYWFKSGRALNRIGVKWLLSYWYQYLFYWRKYSIYIIKVRSVYERIFHKVLPDVNELENILLHKIPVEEKDYVIE